MKSNNLPADFFPCMVALLREYFDEEAAALEARVLLAHAVGVETAELTKRIIMRSGPSLSEDVISRARDFARRRNAGEPSAYITGRKEFYGQDFFVTADTLIPRPETELLVEAAFARALEYSGAAAQKSSDVAQQKSSEAAGVIIDMGCGSGCIGITVACLLAARGLAAAWDVHLLDVSEAALRVAQNNIKKNIQKNIGNTAAPFAHVSANISAHLAGVEDLSPSFVRGLLKKAPARCIIAANLPYVAPCEYAYARENLRFEPVTALVGAPVGVLAGRGSDGLYFVRGLVNAAAACRRAEPDVAMDVLLEIDPAQLDETLRIGARAGYEHTAVLRDARGLARVACLFVEA